MHTFYLVGMPGSGKSTAGRQLAEHLRVPFADVDDAIVTAEGRPIAEVFAAEGEPYFREVEARVLRAVSDGRAFIAACTGSTGETPDRKPPVDPRNR